MHNRSAHSGGHAAAPIIFTISCGLGPVLLRPPSADRWQCRVSPGHLKPGLGIRLRFDPGLDCQLGGTLAILTREHPAIVPLTTKVLG